MDLNTEVFNNFLPSAMDILTLKISFFTITVHNIMYIQRKLFSFERKSLFEEI